MRLQLVSLEVAKLLKRLGFNYECQTFYDPKFTDKVVRSDKCQNWNNYNGQISIFSAPPLELVAKWLRDKYKIYIDIYLEYPLKWNCKIINNFESKISNFTGYRTYEEALLIGINHAIDLICV